MSSDAGTIMDALITAAEGAVGSLTAERTIKYADEINDEAFPYMCVYDPHETGDVGDFQLITKKTRIDMLLFTKGETQEALLLKMDAVRDAIAADRTLGSIVQFAHIIERVVLEEPQVDTKAGYMVLEAVEQIGRIISIPISVEAKIAVGYSDWAALDAAAEAMIDGHVGASKRLTSNLRSDLDTIAANATWYQLAWTLTEYVEHGSNDNRYLASFLITIQHHMGPAAVEETVMHTTLLPKLDGLLLPSNWQALAGIHEVLEDSPSVSLDGIERLD